MFCERAIQRRRGFTLIEILCVVVVLGIVSAAILPQLTSRDDQKAAAAARTVVSDLLYVQNRAIASQKMQYVVFDTVGGAYRVYDKVSPLTLIKHPVTGQNFQVFFGTSSASGLTQMQLYSAGFNGQKGLAFDPMGIPYSYNTTNGALAALTAGTVVVKGGTYSMTVTVAPFSGELTVQ